jgi:hypothetical protein
MTEGTDPNEPTQSVEEYLSWLILFCSKGVARSWLELWDDWYYGDVMELYASMIRQKKKIMNDLASSLSDKYVDAPATILKTLLWNLV